MKKIYALIIGCLVLGGLYWIWTPTQETPLLARCRCEKPNLYDYNQMRLRRESQRGPGYWERRRGCLPPYSPPPCRPRPHPR